MQNNDIFCCDVNKLPEFTAIAGSKEILEFENFYPNMEPIDLSQMQKIEWVLCRYGNPTYSVLRKTSDKIYDVNKFSIVLTPSDTVNLNGKYIQQPIITDSKGDKYRFSQGIINFIPAII